MTYKEIENANAGAKTVNIKGKEYVPVEERIKAFRKLFPDGFIKTEIIRLDEDIKSGICVFKATVGTGDKILGTGYAYEKADSSFINKTSYIENCESSAVGRAIGMVGLGLTQGVASAEEVQNAINNQKQDEPVLRGEKIFCVGCGGKILPAEKAYSINKYGAALCRDCQKKRG